VDDDDQDEDEEDLKDINPDAIIGTARRTRGRQPVKYNFGADSDEEEEEDEPPPPKPKKNQKAAPKSDDAANGSEMKDRASEPSVDDTVAPQVTQGAEPSKTGNEPVPVPNEPVPVPNDVQDDDGEEATA